MQEIPGRAVERRPRQAERDVRRGYVSVEAAEREAIAAALAASDGNRRAAAKQLGVSLRTLFYKIERYRIQ